MNVHSTVTWLYLLAWSECNPHTHLTKGEWVAVSGTKIASEKTPSDAHCGDTLESACLPPAAIYGPPLVGLWSEWKETEDEGRRKRDKWGGGGGLIRDYSPWQSYPGTAPCVRPARPPTILHRPAVCSRWCRPPSGSTHRPAEPHSRTPPRPPLRGRDAQRIREHTDSVNHKKRSNATEVSQDSIFILWHSVVWIFWQVCCFIYWFKWEVKEVHRAGMHTHTHTHTHTSNKTYYWKKWPTQQLRNK